FISGRIIIKAERRGSRARGCLRSTSYSELAHCNIPRNLGVCENSNLRLKLTLLSFLLIWFAAERVRAPDHEHPLAMKKRKGKLARDFPVAIRVAARRQPASSWS